MSLEELLFRNEIVREALGAGEIGRLLATVDRRLEDASLGIAPSGNEARAGVLRDPRLRRDRPSSPRTASRRPPPVITSWPSNRSPTPSVSRSIALTTSRPCAISGTRTSTPVRATSATPRRWRQSRRPAAWPQTRNAGWRAVAPALQARSTYPAAAHFSGARRRAPLSTPRVSPRTESHEQDS